MFDKRKEPRKKLMAFTPVYVLNPRTLLGYLEDMTLGGAKVVGNFPLAENSRVVLAIDFPKDLPIVVDLPFIIKARAARSNAGEDGYEILGFEFSEVTEDQIRVLEAIIQRYEFQRAV